MSGNSMDDLIRIHRSGYGELSELVNHLVFERDEAHAKIAAVERALDDEEANLADDGARLSHSVVRRLRAALLTD